ncbi:hypothetical protein JYU34_015915 [Plutella xylostella]|uniref:Chitin-binding type-2 domain-containing protein n=1 Tax=Plutella xylostella TaxID=51655 RepID=A0ABQ7Q516_PLUXY|nr:hypothetical protein JYU34_015915 [Plutella xylostella]
MKAFIGLVLLAAAASASVCPAESDPWTEDLLLPHPDCSKFYKCAYGEPVEQDCPAGLLYNQKQQYCDYPENVSCGQTARSGEWLPNGCPSSPTVHWLLPAENCNQYYQCVRGDKVLLQCMAGLHYNKVLQVCDYPENAGCA